MAMTQFIVILASFFFIGFMITAYKAYKQISINKKTQIKRHIIDENHVIYKVTTNHQFINLELMESYLDEPLENWRIAACESKNVKNPKTYKSFEKKVSYKMEHA